MSWTLQEAQDMLNLWIAAEKAVATGQSYKIGTRSLQRADLSEIAQRIKYWRSEVARLTNNRKPGARVMRVVPRDL
jgi:uncharacterized small protein (DUF1192 family)